VETVREAAEMVLATAKRLEALIADFKEFARDQQLQLADFELPLFLQDVIAGWEAEASARGIAVQSSVDAPAPMSLRADRRKLQRVLDNLVKNAIEAIDRGPGIVRLAVLRLNDDRIRIDVEDSGPGLPPGVNVFAMFETTKPNGTGLGLSICQEIVRAHGGGIDVAARLPNGTVFRLELPLHGLRSNAR
jgi:signal transduction histidine kinase